MAIKLIGAGLGRTGTMSMKLALEQIGFGPCFHMAELMMDLNRLPAWQQAADGAPDWEMIFAGFAATVDYPSCSFWRELADFYPDAKMLLTIRDADAWFESIQATIFSASMRARVAGSPLESFFDKCIWHEFGARINDREFMTAAFRRHRAAVEQAIPKERLLTYEVGEGLCAFLGVPIPDTPFPHVNSRKEMQQMMAAVANAPSGSLNTDEMSGRIRERMEKLGYRNKPSSTSQN
jgi:hypothetical protein